LNIRKFFTLPLVVFLVLCLPGIFLASLGLKSFLPLDVFYSLSGTFIFCLMAFIFFAIAALILFGFLKLIGKFTKPWRVAAFIFLVLIVVSANFMVLMTFIFTPFHRFSVGEGYCDDPLIAEVQRCEGLDRGILQDRVSAIARYGTAVKDIENVITTYPNFSLKETDCKTLSGQFGQKCFEGSFLRETSDTNFLGVYIAGEKVLVIETENIPLTSTQSGPVFLPEHRPVLSDFVDVTRFADDMKNP
jgi:hypothetical protein